MNPLRPAILLAALVLAACDSNDHERAETLRPAPITAKLLTVTPVEIAIHEAVVGTVQPELQATISAKVTGHLVEMFAVPGKKVASGEVLARIEAPQLAAALERAEAALDNATSEDKRYKALRDSGSVPARDVDRVAAALRIATADRDRIQSQLDEATVRAPFAGRITRKTLDTGDLVQPGVPICRIEDPSRLRLELHVAEMLASRLELDQKFDVRIDAAGLDLQGTVAEVSPEADSASRTFLVKLELPPREELLAGQFGRAHIPRETKSAIVVPAAALLVRGQLSYVAVVGADELANLRIVRTGTPRGEGIEIVAGLEAGERIVSEIPDDFASGTPVRTTP